MSPTTKLPLCLALTQALFWLCLPISGSCASREVPINSFENWKRRCNCSCEKDTLTAEKLIDGKDFCVVKDVFQIDSHGNLLEDNSLNLTMSSLSFGKLTCSTRRKAEKDFNYFLVFLNFTRKENRDRFKHHNVYAIFKQKSPNKTSLSRASNATLITAKSAENVAKLENEKSKLSSPVIRGLSVGLSIGLVTCFVAFFLCIRFTRRKRETPERKQDKTNDYIDEDEDSRPYRIVDLETQISCDSSGYTFLEGDKKDEEKPYQKLCTGDRKPENQIGTQNAEKFELIDADEPVYYLLEQ